MIKKIKNNNKYFDFAKKENNFMNLSFRIFIENNELFGCNKYTTKINIQSIESFLNESSEFGLGATHRVADDEEIQDYLRKRSTGTISKAERYKMPYIHKRNIKIIDEENNVYDTEALKVLIKQRPKKLLKQNEKVSHSGGEIVQYYNIGLPALTALAVNEKTNQFVIVNTCPGAGICKIYCYAKKGGYVQWKNSSLSQTKVINYLLNDPDGFKNSLIAEIIKQKTIKEKKGVKIAIRWHDAGDFFSEDYLKLAYDVARTFPDIQFYAYTKMVSVAASDKPNNFIINFSSGADPSQESQVDFSTMKHSKVVEKYLFADLVYRDEKKKMQYIPEKINELKKRIADHYQIPKRTILTYDEWKNKKKPTKIALSTINEPIKPGPWNVIVKPGDGDESANSLSVVGTYLLMH